MCTRPFFFLPRAKRARPPTREKEGLGTRLGVPVLGWKFRGEASSPCTSCDTGGSPCPVMTPGLGGVARISESKKFELEQQIRRKTEEVWSFQNSMP